MFALHLLCNPYCLDSRHSEKQTSKNSSTWRQSRYSKNQIFNCLPSKIIFLPKNVEYMSPEYNINFNSTKIYAYLYTILCFSLGSFEKNESTIGQAMEKEREEVNVNSKELTVTFFLQIFSFILNFGAKLQSVFTKKTERFIWLKKKKSRNSLTEVQLKTLTCLWTSNVSYEHSHHFYNILFITLLKINKKVVMFCSRA